MWLSHDAGASWIDATSNLGAAVSAVSAIRPSALLLMSLPSGDGNGAEGTKTALLIGTSKGVFVTIVPTTRTSRAAHGTAGSFEWHRLGACSELPMVPYPVREAPQTTLALARARARAVSLVIILTVGVGIALTQVLVAGLSYEPADDTLVAATMGRGVYVMHGASKAVGKALLEGRAQ